MTQSVSDRALARFFEERSWRCFIDGRHEAARELDELSVEAARGRLSFDEPWSDQSEDDSGGDAD